MASHNPVGNPSAPYVMPRPAVTLHGSMPTPPLDCNVPPYSCPNISKNTENIPPQPNGGLLASFQEYAPGPVPDPPVNVDHPSMGPMEGGEVDDCPIVPAAPKKRGRPMGSKNKQGPPAKKQGAPPAAKQEPDKKNQKSVSLTFARSSSDGWWGDVSPWSQSFVTPLTHLPFFGWTYPRHLGKSMTRSAFVLGHLSRVVSKLSFGTSARGLGRGKKGKLVVPAETT